MIMDGLHDYEDYSMEYDGEVDNYETVEYLDEDVPYREDISLAELYEDCAKPTLNSASDQICWLYISCLLFKLLTQTLSLRAPLCHVVSVLCGILSLYSLLGSNATYTCAIAVSTYIGVLFCARRVARGLSYRVMAMCFFSYLLVREYVEVLPESWEQIRGIHMIMTLKSLSVCYEISTFSRQVTPPFLDYMGYILCPASIVFGPWIPLKTYYKVFDKNKWSVDWVTKLFATMVFAFLCLTFSSCWVYWVFLGVKSSWLLAVRDALSVRTSNYFVAFMSESTCLLSGFFSADDPDLNIEVSNPLKIELPRSLVEVVVCWNIPMHQWLKIHIFRPARNLGFLLRILLTFLVSSLLHGLNFHLSAVLLSLGMYTYVEHILREKLSAIFDACIRSRKCSEDCKHACQSGHPAIILTNIMFGFLAYFHLAYLGAIMDRRHDGTTVFQDGLSHHLETWNQLGYASHWVAFGTYIFTLLI